MTHTISILDRLSPDESDLPPSARTWARVIYLGHGPVLELRDANSGVGFDPAEKPRHQYLVSRGCVWTRRLPPAPLDRPKDETPWADQAAAPAWERADLGASSPIWEWARGQGDLPLLPVPVHPEQTTVERDIHGDGGGEYDAYVMPPRDPWSIWPDITSYGDSDHVVTCPVAGCGHRLVWYEAGYVPGYRVCMAPRGDAYDLTTLRHRFVFDHHRHPTGCVVLIREHDREEE